MAYYYLKSRPQVGGPSEGRIIILEADQVSGGMTIEQVRSEG